MSLENLKNIFMIIIDVELKKLVWFQSKRFFSQKYLGDSVQLVHLVEVWNRFAESSCLRLILPVMEDCLWFI